MTIEDKAKAYDEAKLRMSAAYNSNRCTIGFMNEIFPELKESEDERIRKELLEHCKNQAEPYIRTGSKCPQIQSWIAWLEKQGENNKWKPSKDEMDALYGLAYITNKMDDKKDEAITKLYQDLKREFFNGVSYENMFPSSPVSAPIKLKKQGEQKPADETELKFKVGDWIVYHETPLMITGVEKRFYNYVNQESNTNYITIQELEKNSELWTIQDAKEGDVLLSPSTPEGDKECPFIFKEIDKSGIVRFHVALLQSESIKIADGITNVMGYANAGYHTPATKEQRDTLFSKMKEAGYVWDADEKELKKVKKAPQKFMVGDTIKYNGTEYKITEITSNGYKVYALTYDEDAASLISFSAPAILVEWNPVWSEEDEKIRKALFEYFTTSDNNAYYEVCGVATKKILIWLDKQREQKSTWSEEDKELLNDIIVDVEVLKEQDRTKEGKAAYKREIDWLESLKDRVQLKQEWSEDNIKEFKAELQSLMFEWSNKKDNMGVCIDRHIDKLLSILWNHTQSHWKPSKAQIEAVEKALSFAKNCGEESAFDLRKLLEQLKVL